MSWLKKPKSDPKPEKPKDCKECSNTGWKNKPAPDGRRIRCECRK